MAEHIRTAGIAPELVLCSTARRTRETLEGVVVRGKHLIEAELYSASTRISLTASTELSDDVCSAMLIGHNPTMQMLVLRLDQQDGLAMVDPRRDAVKRKFPTGALATLTFECAWSDLTSGRARLEEFVTPKGFNAALEAAGAAPRPALRQRLVEVAALRRLHARRAARAARALADQALRVADQALELVVAAARDPDAARVPVVDEDRRPAGLRVGVGREAADVPAVAHRDQRQHRDLPVLERVQRPEQLHRRERLGGDQLVELVPERARRELDRGQVERLEVDHARGRCSALRW